MGQHIKLDHVPGSIKKTFQRKEIMPLNDSWRWRVDIVHTASFFRFVFEVNIPSEMAKRQRVAQRSSDCCRFRCHCSSSLMIVSCFCFGVNDFGKNLLMASPGSVTLSMSFFSSLITAIITSSLSLPSCENFFSR